MRIVALAGGPVGVSMLDVLAARGHVPVGVVASHAAGGGPGRACPSTIAWCERRGTPWVYWPRLTADPEPEAWLRARAPDLLLSLSYDLILPAVLLACAPRAVNVHRGLAPEFRGAYSTIWALERGAAEVGVTIHAMVPDVDAGAILAQRRLPAPPELTAAEAIVLVERAAVELLDDVADDLLADRLPARTQPAGGEVFGRELPSADLADVGGPALARRVRARNNPPYPGAGIAIGERSFAMVERVVPEAAAPGAAAAPRARPAAPAPVVAANAGAFAGGRGASATWTSTAEEAAALLLATLDGPLAVPELLSPALAAAVRAAGVEVVAYALGADLRPEGDALAAVAPGRTVVLAWPCGRPPSEAVRRLAAARADRVVEDRFQALLAVDPWRGDDALVDLAAWTGSRDGAGVVSDRADLATGGDPRPRPLSRAGAYEAFAAFDAAAARAAMAAAAQRYQKALHRHCPFTHWPPGTVAHGFPVVVEDSTTRAAITRELPGLVIAPFAALAGDDAAAARAAALLALPCHAGVTAGHVDHVLAGLARAGVELAGS
ncbi:MAG TPA: formyltransferase family protein [Baekduia sp.]|jgi:methionyl-tRNA formyltransferase